MQLVTPMGHRQKHRSSPEEHQGAFLDEVPGTSTATRSDGHHGDPEIACPVLVFIFCGGDGGNMASFQRSPT